jgi:hypothetical protein
MQLIILSVTLLLFGALTAAAIWQTGISGIVDWHVKSFGGGQVFADLVIALTLAMVWMWHDARTIGRNVWPWIGLTLVAGSFGPLLYLLTRDSVRKKLSAIAV